MDINESLAQLRAAFPRVTWTAKEDEPGSWTIRGGPVMVWNYSEGWRCDAAGPSPTPLFAVRAWLASQPTAAFYPKTPSGETVEVRGWVAVSSDGEAAFCGTTRDGDNTRGLAIHRLERMTDIRVQDFHVAPVIVCVPVPAEPPALVGEVAP